MNRFLVFIFERYYPAGGWDDLDSSHKTLESAHRIVYASGGFEHYQIVDWETHELVEWGLIRDFRKAHPEFKN
jgi:hypothetical protein